MWPFGRTKRLEARLVEMQAAINTLLERSLLTMSQLDDLITALNDNTNAVGARLDTLVAELAAAGTAPTADQLAHLQAVADHLKALGANPSAPVPTPAPAIVSPPSAPATP